jgi:hypothetical protein
MAMVLDEMRPSETRQVKVEPPGTSWSVAKARGKGASASKETARTAEEDDIDARDLERTNMGAS